MDLQMAGLVAALLGGATVTLWTWRTEPGVRFRASLPTLWGIVLTLSGLFSLWWVTFEMPDYFDDQLTRLVTTLRFERLESVYPPLSIVVAAPLGDQATLFIDLLPDYQKSVATIMRQRRGLSGFDLWRDMPRLGWTLRLGLLLALILPAVALPATLLARAAPGSAPARMLSTGALALAAIGLFLALWHVPTVDSFGIRGSATVALLVFLSGARAGPGLWSTLLGLTLLLIGAGLDLALPASDDGEEPDEFWSP